MEKRREILIFLITTFLFLIFGTSVVARNSFSPLSSLPQFKKQPKGSSCISPECHWYQKLKMEQVRHRHPGFLKCEEDQACISCHLEDGFIQKGLNPTGLIKIHDPALRNIHIVRLSNLTPLTKYRFRIHSTDLRGKTVVMESDDFIFTTAYALSPSGKMPSPSTCNPQDPIPPLIMEISVDEIKWETLIRVKISWKTDKLSTSKVEYGIAPCLGFCSPTHCTPKMEHQVVIHGLRPATTYFYRVCSATPSGCLATSDLNTFATPSKKISFYFLKIMSVLEWMIPPAIAQFSLSPLFISNITISEVTEKSVMITWETNRPSDTLLEYKPVQPEQETNQFVHPPLKLEEESGIETCYGCHPKQKLGPSHPVQVSIPAEMKKPRDLPLGEGERILCTTCHDPHGRDKKFLVRKDRKRELCISCHRPEKLKYRGHFRRR